MLARTTRNVGRWGYCIVLPLYTIEQIMSSVSSAHRLLFFGCSYSFSVGESKIDSAAGGMLGGGGGGGAAF